MTHPLINTHRSRLFFESRPLGFGETAHHQHQHNTPQTLRRSLFQRCHTITPAGMNCSRIVPSWRHLAKVREPQHVLSAVVGGHDNSCNRTTGSYNATRPFSTEQYSTSKAFDRSLKVLQRDNAARVAQKYDSTAYDYIRDEIATRLVDRLDDIRRDEGFPLALDIGSGAGHVYRAICADDAIMGEGGIGGVRKLVQLDSAKAMLERDAEKGFSGQERCDTYRLPVNEEEKLPFPDGTFDLVISSASLHWVNDLPGLFSEINRVLKPDGCFLFAMIGGTTLPELRVSMVLAEQEREGGVSPHVGPFVELSDLGSLLQRHDFALPTLDTDTLRLAFPNAAVLMEHLQRMGEANASLSRRSKVGLDTFLATACLYDHMYPEGGDAVEASVQVIYAIGWTPHESQQKPLERGSATNRMKDIVEHTRK